MRFVKSLTKVSTLASVTSSLMLLVAASGLGFSSLIPTAVASPVVDGGGDTSTTTTMSDNASSLNATTPITPTIELGEEPFAIGRYSPVSETVLNETQQIQIALEGSTTITLPNTTETITTRDRGEGIITFLPGGGVIRGQIQLTTEDGSESATADLTEYFLDEAPTAISIVYFSTNSTGILAPLNQMIAVSLDEEQPNGDVVARLFEWKRGDGGSSGGNDTTTTMTTTTESPAVIPIP
jgi:hypothetical protein